MRNVTLAIDDGLLVAGREYARRNRTTLNNLIRGYLEQLTTNRSNTDWIEETFAMADKAGGNSGGKSWKREDLYDV